MIFDRGFSAGTGARTRKLLLAGTALAGVALLPSLAQAQSVWGGAGSTTTTNDYNTGTNWSTNPVAPVAGGTSAQFGDGTGGAGGTASTAVNVSAPVFLDSWTFLSNSQSYTVTGILADITHITNNANSGQAISISMAGEISGDLFQAGASFLTISGYYFGQASVSAGTLPM